MQEVAEDTISKLQITSGDELVSKSRIQKGIDDYILTQHKDNLPWVRKVQDNLLRSKTDSVRSVRNSEGVVLLLYRVPRKNRCKS